MSDFSSKPFDTRKLFSGGGGLFIQFQDVVTPIYLFAIIKLLLTDASLGLPISIIKDMSILSLAEWYIKRSNINPIQELDYKHQLSSQDANTLLYKILEDRSIYDHSPVFNVGLMFDVYKHKKMNIPIYIYSEYNDPHIEYFGRKHFPDISFKYIYDDLSSAIKKCNDNFTYIFSNIEFFKQACELLKGSYANILLAQEYKYNYIDNCVTTKYPLEELMFNNPFILTGITRVINVKTLANSLQILKLKGR